MGAVEASGPMAAYLVALQAKIVSALARYDSMSFVCRSWESKLGEGTGYLLEGGSTFERAGVSFSQVAGLSLPQAATICKPMLQGQPYEAMGVSLVVHPRNPFTPTVHLNVRFFSTTDAEPIWWFGGGMDLTPHYGFEEDCRHFHTTCKEALDRHNPSLYPRFKANCDKYFFIRHRGQMRGIGGVFFDDYSAGDFAAAQAVMMAVGDSFLPAYEPILARRVNMSYTQAHRAHQLYRRGRYVEFNLIQDRGTLFGLQSGGQADAILMSMPPLVSWDALGQGRNIQDDQELCERFLQPKDWLAN